MGQDLNHQCCSGRHPVASSHVPGSTARTLALTAAAAFWAFLPPAVAGSSNNRPDGSPLLLASGGRSRYRIVVAAKAPPATAHAASELHRFLGEITGAEFKIVTEHEHATNREILVGASRRLEKIAPDLDLTTMGPEESILRTVGSRLVVAGGEPRGTLYAVYALLEDHLGCRWFAPGVSRIPHRETFELAPLDERIRPPLEYREPFVSECFDGDWCARNRMNSSAGRMDAARGGKIRFGQGFFVHTFNRLVPPEEFFDKHPEYFSLVNGKRLKDHSQLCCTNPDVVRICTERILAAMEAQPDATVFSVSQNDWFNDCRCGTCRAVARREGSPMAPVLQLVNQVADAAAERFPDKLVETLAYQWTRHPPKKMRPRPNVVVRLCSIECCFSHPLETCDSKANQAFRADVEGWSKIGNRLWVWNYVTDFHHYLLPFPNLFVRGPNIRFFAAHHVTGIFEQDTYNTAAGELSELGGYLTAKLLWNPEADTDTLIDEFLEGFYGPAADPIREYIELLEERVTGENIHLSIWVGPESPHLAGTILTESNELWDEAESLVEGTPKLLARVQGSRTSVDYAIMERARLQTAGKLAAEPDLRPLARQRFGPFFAALATSPVTRLAEGRPLDRERYRKELAAALEIKKTIKGG